MASASVASVNIGGLGAKAFVQGGYSPRSPRGSAAYDPIPYGMVSFGRTTLRLVQRPVMHVPY